ncbi:acid-sensing ion channel 4-A-like [Stegodyphus dumicola]|uniref:acid-sensing ion channel 4-A-like n=1 Tax=Stegodyphus dumicola TaxID=202533 RepID=UPI0015AD0FC9|nr:acid-sensing ion channel 4-A-like [Stegodyphus dumicola]XP_035209182.1 acid-sensing ion channel 4-A-like [Stegodyphus dumicola]
MQGQTVNLNGHGMQCQNIPITARGMFLFSNQDRLPIKQYGNFFWKQIAKSTISGINSVALAKNKPQRWSWFIVLAGCIIGFAYQTLSFSTLYNSKPTVVQIEVENDGLVEFPAVTICNLNRVRRSAFCEFFPDRCNKTPDFVLTEKEVVDIVYEIMLEGDPDKKRKLGHSSNMIQSCIFNGKPTVKENECTRNLQYYYDPDFGNCYTIPAKNKDGILLQAREADFWQEANDLSVLIDIEYEEMTEKRRHPGVVVTVHDESTLPDIHTEGVLLSTGYSYTLAVQKSSVILLPLPYKTNCTDYFKLPWQKGQKRRYTSRICTVGCSSYYQSLKCNFVTKNVSVFYEKLPFDAKKVTQEEKDCSKAEELRTKNYCRTICGLPCRDTGFAVTVGSRELMLRDIYAHSVHSSWNRSWEEQMHNLVLLKIYYGTLEHKIFRHIPKYDTMELFSYLGGYSGVWLGFSLLTVYELIDIFVSTIIFGFKKYKRLQQQKKVIISMMNSRLNKKSTVKTYRKKRFYR